MTFVRPAGLALLFVFTAASASAQTVSLAGSLGTRALLVIDGKPRQVAVGSTLDGVKLLSLTGNDAVVEVKGQRVTLALGGSPSNLGGAASGGTGDKIVLTSSSGGHFMTSGTVNGSAVRFMVDTGATYISMGAADAERIGLDYKKGQLTYMSTANGAIASYKVSLASVRVGEVQVYNVDAVVSAAPMPFMLLGNSFLDRFQLRRENDQLTLVKK